jgi:DNA-binding transcriptional LysR family regulator
MGGESVSIGLDHLEAFIAAAQMGSQREAAKALGCTQPTISKRIISLEGWLRRGLVDSNVPKGLTPCGSAFLPVAEQVVLLLKQHRAEPITASPPQKTSAKNLRV